MTQFAMQGQVHAYTVASLQHALFTAGEVEVRAAPFYTTKALPWADPARLRQERPRTENEGWYWGGEADGEGIL
jgi:hypothetical protein